VLSEAAIRREHAPGLPLAITQRLESASGRTQHLATEELTQAARYDIGAGLVHGYDTDPALFDAWTGVGMADFVGWLIENRGQPVTCAAFGIDREVANALRARELDELAGVARAAVRGLSVEDLTHYQRREGQKMPAVAVPPRDFEGNSEFWFALVGYRELMPIALLLDMPPKEIAGHFSKLRRPNMAGLASVLVRATRDNLSLESIVAMYCSGLTDYGILRQAVVNGWPEEYIQSYLDEVPAGRRRR